MKLPAMTRSMDHRTDTARPIEGRPSSAGRTAGQAAQGIVPSGLCELACNALPEPARSICKAAC
jgi:hypothetical protein